MRGAGVLESASFGSMSSATIDCPSVEERRKVLLHFSCVASSARICESQSLPALSTVLRP
jgi:hypothetical protein